MIYLFSVAAGLVGGFAAVLLLSGRRPRRRREGKQSRRKIECSKLVLWAVLCTYFAGFGVGVWAVVLDVSQLGVFLAYGKADEPKCIIATRTQVANAGQMSVQTK